MKTNFLILGNGGREHAIAWKLQQSPLVESLVVAPGNPGTASIAINEAVDLSDFNAVLALVRKHAIDVVVVGPEQPLVDGITDFLRKENVQVFGPNRFAAMLEGSKSFAKKMMEKGKVPTADYKVFALENSGDIVSYLSTSCTYPTVLKVDGLAGGKGVFICENQEEAIQRYQEIIDSSSLCSGSDRLVIEEFMKGEEASVFALCDGKNFVLLSPAQDHKRIGDNDTGRNTGGMGAYCPAPVVSENILEQVRTKVIQPMLDTMSNEGYPYVGVLYCGLMIHENAVKVVEFNCRFGDPECQVILPALKSDLAEIIITALKGRLSEISVEWSSEYFCSVVLASKGYPEQFEKGKIIEGLDQVHNALVFHSGTKVEMGKPDDIVTSGGRVLNVVGAGKTLEEAIDMAYKGTEHIHFEGKYLRTDIGRKGLKHLNV